jgi:hypothetical protein
MSRRKTPSDLRTVADEKISSWRSIRAATSLARREANALEAKGDRTLTGGLALTLARLAVLDTEDVERVAYRDAAVALDAADFADGEPLVLASDLGALHADLQAGLERVERARVELREAERAFSDRHAQASTARKELDARRIQSDLPHALYVPEAAATSVELVEKVSAALSTGRPIQSNAGKRAALLDEEISIRASIERARIRAEEEAAQSAWLAEQAAKARARDADAERAQNAQVMAEYAAAREEERRLAEAHRARELGAAS